MDEDEGNDMKQYFSGAKQYFAFQWHITDECDQRCKHCYIFSEDNCKKPDVMDWQQMQDTFYNCLDFCETYGRLLYFYITGGDPIIHPDFWKLLELLKENAIPFTFISSLLTVCRKPMTGSVNRARLP